MSKKNAPVSPPLPHIDPPAPETVEYIANLSKKERRRLRKSIKQDEAFQNFQEKKKSQRSKHFKEWWRNNWVAFLGLIFAFISAIPVIIQGMLSILELLK